MSELFDENLIISPDFVQKVRDLLEHLYDFPYLQKQILVLSLNESDQPVFEISGQKARKYLLDALEKIGDEKSLSFRSSQARIYNLLRLHYIEGMSINDVARELGLSPRQTYRDLRSSDERIAAIVWTNLTGQLKKDGIPLAVETETQLTPVNLNELITTVCNTIGPLAALRSVDIQLDLPEKLVTVQTDAMIARQVITGLLSMSIQQTLPHPLEIKLTSNSKEYLLHISYQTVNLPIKAMDPSVDLYAQNLGWQISQQVNKNSVEILVSIQSNLHIFLIIDDHPGFVELMERYMDNSNIRMATADNGLKGIELAHQLQPEVIFLDVMIPEMDGWQVLQRLHSIPATKNIPVIVCSVFYDPDLAMAMGAVDVLKKPFRKEDLDIALRRNNIL